MYGIEQINYHYYHELTEYLNEINNSGFEVIQIIDIKPSGDNEKMHRATILTKDINNTHLKVTRSCSSKNPWF